MKKQLRFKPEVNETRFTLFTNCEVTLGESFSEFEIVQHFKSTNQEIESLVNEIIFFVKKTSKFCQKYYGGDGQTYHTQIIFETFTNYERISDFSELLSTKIKKIDHLHIDCSLEVYLHLYKELLYKEGTNYFISPEDLLDNFSCPEVSWEYFDKEKWGFTIRQSVLE